jgi:hypothetical protein
MEGVPLNQSFKPLKIRRVGLEKTRSCRGIGTFYPNYKQFASHNPKELDKNRKGFRQ